MREELSTLDISRQIYRDRKSAGDGYQALFSLAEVDTSMSDHAPLLAWERNGKPLPETQGPLRLIVSGDKRPARWVRQATAIEVVS